MDRRLSSKDLISALQWRYATKVFDASKKIASNDWKALEEVLILTPSSYGLQPWKFIVITDRAMKQKLLPISWNQKQVIDCSHYVVFAGRADLAKQDVDKLIETMVRIQGRDASSIEMYRTMMMGDLVSGPRHAMISEWVSRQVYIALGNFMTASALLGIDTCPMEGIDSVKYDQALGLQGGDFVTKVACAAGYRSITDKYAALAKVRYPASELIQTIA